MKNTFKFFAAALIIVAAASCTKENPSTDSQVSDQKLVHKVFTASLNADSKTTLVSDPDGGAFVHWTKGDKIVVLPSGSTNASAFSIVDDSIDEDYASFAGNVADANSYVGIYPAEAFDHSETSWDNSGIIHFFKNETLATQYANVGDFPRTKYGNANIAISKSSKNEHLYFENVNAYLKFTLSVSGAVEIVFSADAISNDNPSTGNTLSSLNLGSTLRYKNGYMYGSYYDTPITFKVDDNMSAFEKDAVYYVAIPAVYIKGLKMTVKDANGDDLAVFSKTDDFVAESNKIYNIGTITKPKALIGDYYYKDGTVGRQYNSNAVGVVFYVGDPHGIDPSLPEQCKTGLVVGLKEYSGLYYGTERDGNTKELQPDYYGVNTYADSKSTANSVLDAVSKDIMAISYAYEMSLRHSKKIGGSELYSSYNFGTTSYGSGWLIPSAKEYSLMYKSLDVLNSKDGFEDLKVWTTIDKSNSDSNLGECVIGYHTVWQANINGEDGWRCLNYYYIDASKQGLVQAVSNTNQNSVSTGHIGRAIFAF